MADSDPISEAYTPNKRRKTDEGQSNGQVWDSQNDSGEDFTPEDFETQPTMPLPQANRKRKQLSYPASAFHSDMSSMTARTTANGERHITQPTQPLGSQTAKHVTQPTQSLPPPRITPPSSDVLVGRSSPSLPGASSSPKSVPAPVQRAPFSRPTGGLLAQSLAPSGTGFKRPQGVRQKPEPIPVDDSDDEDPPVHHSSDEETQGLKSNLKPTVFKRGGRGLDSTPNRSDRVRESPYASSQTARPINGAAPPASTGTAFSSIMSQFKHDENAAPPTRRPGSDMASSYGGVSRQPRPQQRQARPPQAQQTSQAVMYPTIESVPDFLVRRKIMDIQRILTGESVQRIHDALDMKKGNVEDAKDWLADHEPSKEVPDSDGVDELGSGSPMPRKGVAISKLPPPSMKGSSQPVRPAAKQQVKAPSKSIAEKYGSTQAARKPSQPAVVVEDDEDEEEEVRPQKRRLLKGRKPGRSPSPPSSPPSQQLPQEKQRLQQKKQTITISDDEGESDSGLGREESEEPVKEAETDFDSRLLKFFNECTARDLAELSGQPDEPVNLVISKRPFTTLDDVREVTSVTETTKSGKKSKARPIGDKMVDSCTQMWSGYDAVDALVSECEQLAKPIQQALKGWGASQGEGELQLLNLDEAHDSGIGTPASSHSSDDAFPTGSKPKKLKGGFLGQPDSMTDIVLKDYQLVGLNWLHLLWTKKMSCILADDMGLGKTAQVISFLAQLQKDEVDGVQLVIVPGSTLENWLREFARFAPSLNVQPYYGPQLERMKLQGQIEEDFEGIDVIVTTYDMAVKKEDNSFLRRLGPAVCIYDEAHQLRNPNSQRYEGLMRIKADFKVLLTGTPLQNNLQELVAILAFIMPKLFEDRREDLDFIFKHKATTKDADHAALLSAERIARARTMMTPFILRRKKQQVLDLPTKHSRVEWCDMTPSQEAYYSNLVSEAQQVFAQKTGAGGKSKAVAKKDTSNILMALRQAAIHPLLARRLYSDSRIGKIVDQLSKSEEFGGNERSKIEAFIRNESNTGINLKGGDYGLHRFCAERDFLHKFALKKNEWMDCGKVQKFKELIESYVKNGDRLLVFSQFTTLMDILEAVLETLAVKFMRLDGSTKMNERQDMIDQFYTDTSIPVFMLSTKAGGAGINLACANKVIIFDSGFNPQDDIQAENRAHRVGQTREVEVVRLVTRGTIEEQIHALGESKLALDDRVAGEAATAAEDKAVEKEGEEMVQRLFMDSLQKRKTGPDAAEESGGGDIRDAFKLGMEKEGVQVKSKQARF
ncbi:hypothetical protein B0A50_07824 [Salinomyces thailandicus]|uniref:DNA helicase n=1 Tax=Salinomyces thailandicus TaxID=706561 RepID=A0A4U0TME7_9PEZI|nr:hypothetical protein B0A50_07824 [Salinomyces thailandica]